MRTLRPVLVLTLVFVIILGFLSLIPDFFPISSPSDGTLEPTMGFWSKTFRYWYALDGVEKNGVGFMALVLVLFLPALVSRFFYKRWDYQDLARQKEELEEQNDQINHLIRELNHRAQNNLQFIASLLNLQASRLNHPDGKKALTNIQSRIYTMGVIHQNLYAEQAPGSKAIDMEEQIMRLTGSLSQMYPRESAGITFRVGVITEKVDPQRAQTLLLILSEWITNSFKHAFQPQERFPKREIRILLKERLAGASLLEIFDNGTGIPAARTESQEEFGLYLVSLLAKELGGTLRTICAGGTRQQLIFDDPTSATPIQTANPKDHHEDSQLAHC